MAESTGMGVFGGADEASSGRTHGKKVRPIPERETAKSLRPSDKSQSRLYRKANREKTTL